MAQAALRRLLIGCGVLVLLTGERVDDPLQRSLTGWVGFRRPVVGDRIERDSRSIRERIAAWSPPGLVPAEACHSSMSLFWSCRLRRVDQLLVSSGDARVVVRIRTTRHSAHSSEPWSVNRCFSVHLLWAWPPTPNGRQPSAVPSGRGLPRPAENAFYGPSSMPTGMAPSGLPMRPTGLPMGLHWNVHVLTGTCPAHVRVLDPHPQDCVGKRQRRRGHTRHHRAAAKSEGCRPQSCSTACPHTSPGR